MDKYITSEPIFYIHYIGEPDDDSGEGVKLVGAKLYSLRTGAISEVKINSLFDNLHKDIYCVLNLADKMKPYGPEYAYDIDSTYSYRREMNFTLKWDNWPNLESEVSYDGAVRGKVSIAIVKDSSGAWVVDNKGQLVYFDFETIDARDNKLWDYGDRIIDNLDYRKIYNDKENKSYVDKLDSVIDIKYIGDKASKERLIAAKRQAIDFKKVANLQLLTDNTPGINYMVPGEMSITSDLIRSGNKSDVINLKLPPKCHTLKYISGNTLYYSGRLNLYFNTWFKNIGDWTFDSGQQIFAYQCKNDCELEYIGRSAFRNSAIYLADGPEWNMRSPVEIKYRAFHNARLEYDLDDGKEENKLKININVKHIESEVFNNTNLQILHLYSTVNGAIEDKAFSGAIIEKLILTGNIDLKLDSFAATDIKTLVLDGINPRIYDGREVGPFRNSHIHSVILTGNQNEIPDGFFNTAVIEKLELDNVPIGQSKKRVKIGKYSFEYATVLDFNSDYTEIVNEVDECAFKDASVHGLFWEGNNFTLTGNISIYSHAFENMKLINFGNFHIENTVALCGEEHFKSSVITLKGMSKVHLGSMSNGMFLDSLISADEFEFGSNIAQLGIPDRSFMNVRFIGLRWTSVMDEPDSTVHFVRIGDSAFENSRGFRLPSTYFDIRYLGVAAFKNARFHEEYAGKYSYYRGGSYGLIVETMKSYALWGVSIEIDKSSSINVYDGFNTSGFADIDIKATIIEDNAIDNIDRLSRVTMHTPTDEELAESGRQVYWSKNNFSHMVSLVSISTYIDCTLDTYSEAGKNIDFLGRICN